MQSRPPWTDCLPRVPHHTSLSFFPLLQGCPLTRAHGAAPSSAPDWSDLDHMLDPQLGVGSTESVGDGSWRSTRAHGSCPTQNQAGQGMDGHSLSTVPPTWQGPSLASPHPAPPPRPVPWNFLHFLPLKPPCGLPCKAPPHTHTLISNCIRKKLPREFQWRNLLRTWKQRAWKGWRTVGQTESKCYRMLLSGARGARGGLLPSPHVAESPEGRTAGDAPL